MTNTTPNLNIAYLWQSQAQKEVTANEAFLKIDMLLNNGAISRSQSSPPASPNDGDLYIISSAASDAWLGHDDEIAGYDSNLGWIFYPPNEGMSLWVNDEDKIYVFDGNVWVTDGGSVDLSAITELGVNASADSTNRLAVSSDAILFNHAGNGSQIKINKNSAVDTGSHLFQTNWSGRAEFGLTGDDDFHVKVSADGSNWHDSMIVKNSNGQLYIQQGISFDYGTNILNQYEEGDFTPTIIGTTNAGNNSYTLQSGSYTRIGNRVFTDIFITIDNLDSTGNLQIAGFPFATFNSSRMVSADFYITGLNFTHPTTVIAISKGGQPSFDLFHYIGTGMSALTSSEVGNALQIRGCINYRV